MIPDGHPESGFSIEDGAIYVNHERQQFNFIVDLPFRRSKDADLTLASQFPNQSNNDNIAFGANKAQRYLKGTLSDQNFISIGQFDTILGFELNDSKDRRFGKTGIVFDALIPNTHTGIMGEHHFANQAFVKVIIANPNNKGSFGYSADGDNHTEYTLAVGQIQDS